MFTINQLANTAWLPACGSCDFRVPVVRNGVESSSAHSPVRAFLAAFSAATSFGQSEYLT